MAQNKKSTLSKNGSPIVSILTGSPSDFPVVNKAKDVLDELGIPAEVHAMSAHRTPDLVMGHVTGAKDRGVEVIIACAGMAAHLAGVVAAHTTLPVIGVPLESGGLGGMDALLATVQMPPGIPVATVGIDGSKNAAFLAARILGLGHPELIARIEARMAKDRERYEVPSKGKKRPAKGTTKRTTKTAAKKTAKKTAKKATKRPAKKATKRPAKKATKRPAKKRASKKRP